MNGDQQFSNNSKENIDVLTEPPNAHQADESTNNKLAIVAIGTFIGATLGALAAALTIKDTTDKVDQTAKNMGNAVKGAARSFNQNVTNLGGAIKIVADSVNDTVKDVGDTLKDTALNVNDTATNTVHTVKSTATNVNDTVKTTVNTFKGVAVGVKDTVTGTVDITKNVVEDDNLSKDQNVNIHNNQTAYMLVPIDKSKQGL
jgi:gas vesicle protein